MKKMYMWEVEYQVNGSFVTMRSVKVATTIDSFGEAERLALIYIKEQLKESGFEFNFISRISPSQLIYSEGGAS